MALTERSRSALYQGLTDLIEDEVAVGELLSYFPARDVEEPATKEFVAAEIASLRADLTAQIAALQRTMIQWTLGAMVSLVGLVLAVGVLRAP